MKKSTSHLTTQRYKQTRCYDPSQCSQLLKCITKTPHTITPGPPNFFAMGAPASAGSCHLKLPHKVQPVPFQPLALHSEQPGNRALQQGQAFVLQWSTAKTFFINALLFCSLDPT